MMDPVDKAAASAIHIAEKIGLFLIAIATIIAIGQEVEYMIEIKTVRLADLLLLFIYLEVLTMVSSYLKSGSLPIRMPLYIAMVALARYIVLDVKGMEEWELIAVSSGILIISVAVLVHRYGHIKFPYPGSSDKEGEVEEK